MIFFHRRILSTSCILSTRCIDRQPPSSNGQFWELISPLSSRSAPAYSTERFLQRDSRSGEHSRSSIVQLPQLCRIPTVPNFISLANNVQGLISRPLAIRRSIIRCRGRISRLSWSGDPFLPLPIQHRQSLCTALRTIRHFAKWPANTTPCRFPDGYCVTD